VREVVTSCAALRPISELPVKNDAFLENVADRASKYICDGKSLILKEAIRRRDRAELHARKVGFLNKFGTSRRLFTVEYCENMFNNMIARAIEPAVLLGYFDGGPFGTTGGKSKGPFYIAVSVTAANHVILLNAWAVRLIDSLVGGFDALMSAGEHDAFAFFRQGRPVAILMPLIPKMIDLPDGVAAVAREHTQRLKENQDVGAYEYGATKRGTA